MVQVSCKTLLDPFLPNDGNYSTDREGLMKPKILITIDTYAIGGPGKVILQFLRYGGLEQCDAHVAGFWRGADRPWQFRDAAISLGVPFHTLVQRFTFDPLVIKAALKLVRDGNINILVSHGYKAHVVCFALRQLTGIPWVAYSHGWTSENLKVEAYNLIDKGMVRLADRIIPVSESLANRLHLSPKLRERTHVIANAADIIDTKREFPNLRLQYGVRDDEILLGVVGRLSPEKGHSFFIEAFNTIAPLALNVKALLVGEGQERDAITRSIRQYGLEERIMLTGYQKDVSPFHNAFDMLVLPSLSEGMPNAALEAMMFAKPVIASRVGGIPEVVLDGETGMLVPAKNPSALADALLELIRDQQKRTMMGRAGEIRVHAEFDPRERVTKVIQLYKTLLESHT
jgi:glycosyltransferase involved in cell wall biosynthesis